jgi:DNA-binding response OmpR family regulator
VDQGPGAPGTLTGHVLVVDDEERLVTLVRDYLGALGATTEGCHDGLSALEAARRPDVDAVVLDLMLPVRNGLEVCRTLRAEGNDVPVLMLTARGTVPERVSGLEAGADDYLVKPFALEELAARVKALLRRREPASPHEDVLRAGDVRVDVGARRTWVGDDEVTLSRREFDLLRALLERAGRAVTRDRLFDEVWADEVDINSNALDVHVSRVRARIAASRSVRIATLRGVGYRLEASLDAADAADGAADGAANGAAEAVPEPGGP